jgi:Pentapeptide repeats (8 copies)
MTTSDWAQARKVAALDPGVPFHEKILVAGLDPSRDLCYGFWAGIDFRGARLAGFDFSGSDLSGCSFAGAYIAGAYFDRAILARSPDQPPADLTSAADYAKFVRTCKPSRRAPRESLALTHWRSLLRGTGRRASAAACARLGHGSRRRSKAALLG